MAVANQHSTNENSWTSTVCLEERQEPGYKCHIRPSGNSQLHQIHPLTDPYKSSWNASTIPFSTFKLGSSPYPRHTVSPHFLTPYAAFLNSSHEYPLCSILWLWLTYEYLWFWLTSTFFPHGYENAKYPHLVPYPLRYQASLSPNGRALGPRLPQLVQG